MRLYDVMRLAAFAAATVLVAQPTLADGSHKIGSPAPAAKAGRTVEVVMNDNYYGLDALAVQPGETIRFVVRNDGTFVHEFALGTPEMHAAHQKEMAMMQEHGMLTATGMNQDMKGMDHSAMGMGAMTHDDPNTVLVEPGQTAELVWTFKSPMTLEFACNVPGHYESGMVGTLTVAPPTTK
ncbi:MAG: copper-binding protein [Rhodospirillaceae bacterium BRH_c57]|nr:MAG: copper-binding protein [Rhodospirillaceae bacterium BRH_c57]